MRPGTIRRVSTDVARQGTQHLLKIWLFLVLKLSLYDNLDDFIWVFMSDLPSVYLDKSITTGDEALETYCEVMREWANNVQS